MVGSRARQTIMLSLLGWFLYPGDAASLCRAAHVLLVLLRILSVLPQLLLVLLQDTLGKALKNPFVAKAFLRSESLEGVPLETPADQVNELGVWRLSQLLHDVLEAILLFFVADDFESGWHCRFFILKLFEKMLSS